MLLDNKQEKRTRFDSADYAQTHQKPHPPPANTSGQLMQATTHNTDAPSTPSTPSAAAPAAPTETETTAPKETTEKEEAKAQEETK